MAAIILDSDKHDIADLIRYLDGDHHMGVYDRAQVVKDLKAQIPKPAIEEPGGFGSIVRAVCLGGSEQQLWQRSYGDGKHYWESETGVVDVWSDLTDVEVLRVGIGDLNERYRQGRTDFAEAVRRDLTNLMIGTRIGERRDAYKEALDAVAALLGES